MVVALCSNSPHTVFPSMPDIYLHFFLQVMLLSYNISVSFHQSFRKFSRLYLVNLGKGTSILHFFSFLVKELYFHTSACLQVHIL